MTEKKNSSICSLKILYILIYKLLWLLPILSFAQNATITIDAGIQYQTIEGLGGWIESGTIRRGTPQEAYDNTPLWDMLINDLGLTQFQISFPAAIEDQNDNDDPNIINWSAFDPNRISYYPDGNFFGEGNVDIKVLKALQREALRSGAIINFHMCAWGYPAWLTGWLGSGGRVNDYEELAELVFATIKIYRDQLGIPINIISLINEPGMWMQATPREISDMVVKVKTRFQQEGLDTRIAAPETAGSDLIDNYLFNTGDPWILPYAEPYLDVYFYHIYDIIWFGTSGGGLGELRNFTQRTGIPSWQTQACNYKLAGGDMTKTNTYEEGLYLGVHIHEVFVEAGSTGFVWWILYAPSYNDPRSEGQILIDVDWGSLSPNPSPKYYAMKQFSRYIPIGAKRIDVQGGNWDLLVSAYLHHDGTFTLVSINLGGERDVTFNLNGISFSSLNRTRFSEGENSQDIGNLNVSGASFSDRLKEQSITTYTTHSSNGFTFFDTTPPASPAGVTVRQND
ncbi:MAG: glycoside hydrolase family 30 beta sandwich domain-containing protein [Candidatus Hodarchaeota archaeon]